jgi:DNA-binding CsgD family transcriptional regulator
MTVNGTTTVTTTPPIVGRGPEREQLRKLLVTAVAGRSASLVLRGGPGSGKTALLEDTVRAAVNHRVVHVRGVAAETDLPYSALHLVCSALGAELSRLGPHQREALETAVGLRAGPAPNQLMVCVAVVELLTLAAQAQPLLCVVDDAQWLDTASSYVLSFVSRRLGPVPVALVFAGRDDSFGDLPQLTLKRLSHADARALLESAVPARLDEAVLDRMVAEARGIPSVLIGSARAASSVDLAGGYGAVAAKDAEESLMTGLAPESRLLLVLAAAEPLGDPVRLWQAAGRLGIEAHDADQLESAGLLSFGAWVAFRDPRLRWSVYGLATAVERRRVHRALAEVTDAATEPDRHAWHLAHALVGPDDAVGDELARAAGTARDRGGLAAEAAFLERAAVSTAVPELRVARATSAANAYHLAGAADAAVRLLATAEVGSADETSRAKVAQLRARMAFDVTRGRADIAKLLKSAQDLEALEPDLAKPAYLEALGAAIFTGHVDVAHTVLARLARQQPRGTDRLLDGVALRCTAGYAAAVEPLKLALKALDCDHEHDPRSRLLGCLVAPDLWDDDTWHELTEAEVAHAKRTGARTLLPYVLTHRALVEIHTGRFTAAQSLVDEVGALTDAAGTPPFPHAVALLAAWRGHDDPALAVPDDVGPGDGGLAVKIARYGTAVLRNGLGDYGEAVTATRGALEGDGIDLQGWALVELIEGAVRSGDCDTAEAALERLSERAFLSGTNWALGVEARSRALLRDGQAAEDLYGEAIDRLERTRITTQLARTQLLYGEWLRRRGRRVDARGPLRAAHESFAEMGAEAFAGRAMRELLATGERARRRVPETQSQLTPQERRIATLARDGRSNPEIATTLSISPRTVEYHLHKVFTKLSIGSRTELHLVLDPERRQYAGSALA